MRGTIGGLLAVIDSTGTPEIAAAALQRHLGETVWFPTALLPSQGVTWTAIDDSRARASISARGVAASVEFNFGADGLVAFVRVPNRLFDDGKSKPASHPWRACITGWCEMHGVKLPAEAVAEWLFASGPYAYWVVP